MLEELEFISGNPDQLQGKCVLYTTNSAGTENPFNPKHPTLAVGGDPSDLLDMLTNMLPFPDELRETLMGRLKESNDLWNRTMFGHHMYRSVLDIMHQGFDHLNIPEDLKKELENELAGLPDEKFGAPLHGCFIPLVGFDPSIIDVYKKSCDIIKAPEVTNITYAGLVLAGHAQHYLASYFMQREIALSTSAKDHQSTVPNFKDLSKDAFLKLLKRKISELMFMHETHGSSDQSLKDLQQLTSGTYLVRDILNLSRLVETNHPHKIKMMELYLQRVQYLVNEQYEKISTIDRQIQELDQINDL